MEDNVIEAEQATYLEEYFDQFMGNVKSAAGTEPSPEILAAMKAFFFCGVNAVLWRLFSEPLEPKVRGERVKEMMTEISSKSFLEAAVASIESETKH
jgi:hypothetical protein